MTARMLVIETNGTTRLVENADYHAINAAVGGWIEGIPVDADVRIYVNEEGKLNGLPANPVADEFWAEVFPREHRMPGDFLVGPVAIFGPEDDEGDSTDVPDWVLARFDVSLDTGAYNENLPRMG